MNVIIKGLIRREKKEAWAQWKFRFWLTKLNELRAITEFWNMTMELRFGNKKKKEERKKTQKYANKKKNFFSLFSGLFVIDDKQVVRQITINDLPVGRDVDETLRLVQAFQYVDKHGEGLY